MDLEILKRTLPQEEGIRLAYQYFNEEKLIEAALMFCTYNNKENALQITTDQEAKSMVKQLHEMYTTYCLVDLIKKGLLLPSLDENNEVVFSVNQ